MTSQLDTDVQVNGTAVVVPPEQSGPLEIWVQTGILLGDSGTVAHHQLHGESRNESSQQDRSHLFILQRGLYAEYLVDLQGRCAL